MRNRRIANGPRRPERDILRSASGRHHVMIDVSRARGVILVTAKEESANAVATIIQATLAQRQRLSIDLRPLRAVLGHDEGGQFFTAPTILDNVGRMTGVAIEVQDSGDTVGGDRSSCFVGSAR